LIRRPPRLLTSSLASTQSPRCRHMPSIPHQNLCPGFEAQTQQNPPPMVLRPKPPNRAASSVPRTRPPPTCVLPSQMSTALTQSTRSLHVSSHLSMSQVSATTVGRPAIRSLDLSLTSALPRLPAGFSARHALLDLHLAVNFRIRSSAPAQHKSRNTSLDTPQCASQDSRSKRKKRKIEVKC